MPSDMTPEYAATWLRENLLHRDFIGHKDMVKKMVAIADVIDALAAENVKLRAELERALCPLNDPEDRDAE